MHLHCPLLPLCFTVPVQYYLFPFLVLPLFILSRFMFADVSLRPTSFACFCWCGALLPAFLADRCPTYLYFSCLILLPAACFCPCAQFRCVYIIPFQLYLLPPTSRKIIKKKEAIAVSSGVFCVRVDALLCFLDLVFCSRTSFFASMRVGRS